MSEETDLAERFISATKRKGVTPLELFEEHDRWNRGSISMDTFKNCLASISFYIKRNEIDLIRNNYCTNNEFEYKRFCKDISPTGTLSLSRSTHINQNNQQENLIKLAKEFRYTGLNIFDYLKGYDINHDGKVSMAVFLQATNGSPLIKTVIQPYYNKSTNEVNYVQLQRDIDQIRSTDKIDQVNQVTEPIPEVFKNFATDVHAGSIALKESFADHDQYKRGKVPQYIFLASIGKFGLQYSPYQLQQMMKPFITSDGQVDYHLFCQEVDKLAPEKEEITKVDHSSPLEPLLESIKTEVRNRHISLNSRIKGRMASDDFFNILFDYRLLKNLNDKIALNKAYQISPNEIDADSFIEKVDPPPHIQMTTTELVIERLKNHLINTNQSLLEHISNFDRERSKKISVLQFRSVLNSIQFNATSHEILQISKQFGDGSSFIYYDELCKLIETRPIETETRDVFMPAVTPSNNACLDSLTKIYNSAKNYQIDLRGEFLKSDPRKRGAIPLILFKKVLGVLPLIRLNSEDMASLFESYTDFYTHNVYYTKFCDDVEKIGSTHTIPPRTVSPRITPNSSPIKSRSTDLESGHFELPKQTSFIDSIRDSILTTLKKCAAASQAGRMTIGDLFSYHDVTNDGFVNTRDVKAILRPFDSYLDDESYTQIIESFKDRRMPEKFAWRKFFSEVTDTKITPEELNNFTQAARLKLGLYDNVSSICNCIRARLISRRKRVFDLFFDVRSDDVISEAEFRRHLDRCGFGIPENEMVSLIRHYQNSDFSGIKWRDFCADVDSSRPMA